MGFGGGKSKQSSDASSMQTSNSGGTGVTGSSSQSYVDPAQAAQLNAMRQEAMKMFGASSGIVGTAEGVAAPLMQDTAGFMSVLRGLSDPTKQIEAQTEGLKTNMIDAFARGKQQIGANAEAAGAFGGSRHGLAEAALGGEMAKAFAGGYGDIVANANAQAGTAAQAGIAAAPGIYNLGMMPSMAGWQPLGALANLLGDPTILNKSSSFGRTNDWSSSISAQQSQSRGKDSKFNMGFEF